MNMENIPKSQLDKEQLLQSLQPLTTVPLDLRVGGGVLR